MSEETSLKNESAASWFADINLKTVLLVAGVSSLFGVGGGAGIVASKAVQVSAAGLSEDKADVRYLTKEEADRRASARDRQMEDAKREIKADIDKTLKKETFEIWLQTWNERQKTFDDKLDRILEK